MQKTPLSLTNSASGFDSLFSPALSLADLASYAEGWLLDGEIRQHSPQTQVFRRMILDKLLWFLQGKLYLSCGKPNRFAAQQCGKTAVPFNASRDLVQNAARVPAGISHLSRAGFVVGTKCARLVAMRSVWSAT